MILKKSEKVWMIGNINKQRYENKLKIIKTIYSWKCLVEWE